MELQKDINGGRLVWVDIAKAIAIFLVVLGHSGIQSTSLQALITGVHMPMFVFLSGYVFSYKKGIIEVVVKDVKTLIIPYYFFAFLLIPFMWIIESISGQHALAPTTIAEITPPYENY